MWSTHNYPLNLVCFNFQELAENLLKNKKKIGKVAARFYGGNNATGYVLCESKEAAQEMAKLKGQLEQLVGGTVSVLRSEAIDTNKFMDIQKSERLTDIENEAVTNRALYRIAAGFIRACSGDDE